MKHIVCLFAFVLLAATAFAQSQYAHFVCNDIQDLAGNKLLSGTITFTPVLTPGSTLPAQPHLVGGGRSIATPITWTITSGVCSATTGTAQLVDVTQANPANFCYASSVHDNNTGDTWTPDTCLQPAYNATGCTVTSGQTTCDYDNMVPTGTPGALQVPVPTGPNWRGTWNSSLAYNLNDAVSFGGSSYISTINMNTSTPGASGWTILAEAGAPGPNCASDSPAGTCVLTNLQASTVAAKSANFGEGTYNNVSYM